MIDPRIQVRVIAEVGDGRGAEAEMRRIAPLMEAFAPVVEVRVEEYPKFAHNWSLSFVLRAAELPHTLFERVLALAADGWLIGELDPEEEDPERWAVWNETPGTEFLTPRVRWAHVQLWDQGAQPTEPMEYLDDEDPGLSG